MAHTINYNDVEATGKTQQFSYSMTANPSLASDMYDRLVLTVDVLISGTDESDLATQYTTLIDAWRSYNCKLIYSIDENVIFSYKHTGARNTDAGLVKPRFSRPTVDQAGACLKFTVTFEYSLDGSGGFSPRRGHYNISWNFDAQQRASIQYSRRERWDETTYPEFKDQAWTWLTSNYTFPDGVAIDADSDSWQLDTYNASISEPTRPDGTDVPDIYIWLTYEWTVHEKQIPFPTTPSGDVGLLKIIEQSMTLRLEPGTVFGPVYVLQVNGSAQVKKPNRDAALTEDQAQEVFAKWGPVIEQELEDRFIDSRKWNVIKTVTSQWDVTNMSLRFSIECRAKKSLDTYLGRKFPVHTYRHGSAHKAGKFYRVEINVSSEWIEPHVIHRTYSGIRIVERTGFNHYRISISGSLGAFVPPANISEVVPAPPNKIYYTHPDSQCVSFRQTPHMPKYISATVQTVDCEFASTWELYNGVTKVPWQPVPQLPIPPIMGGTWQL